MGWSTMLFTNVEFNRQTYNTLSQVEDAIDECKDMIKTAKEHIKKLAYMTEPRKFCSEGESPEEYINDELNWLEELEDSAIELYKLELLKYSWDKCHNKDGLAIEAPEGIEYDTAYLDGDFIYTTKHPTQKTLLGYEVDHEGNVVDDSDAIVDENGKFKN